MGFPFNHDLKLNRKITSKDSVKLYEEARLPLLVADSMKEKTGRITRLWLAMIRVSDMESALHFYNEILGLPTKLDARTFNHAEVGPDEPLAKIGLHATGRKSKRKRRTGIVFDTDNINALYENLRKQGVKFTLKPTKMPWGGIVADFLDPDGNELEVVQDAEHYKRKYTSK